MNLAIISTAGHYYNLLECLAHFGIEKKDTNLLFLPLKSDLNTNKFIQNYLSPNEWHTFRKFDIWGGKVEWLVQKYNLLLVLKFLFKSIYFIYNKKFSIAIVNQANTKYYRFVLKLCKYNQLISLDEGNAVLQFVKDRQSHKNVGLFQLEKITFFSSYDLKIESPDLFVKNEYQYSRAIISKKFIDKESILLIGSPLVEDKLLGLSIYRGLLKKIKNYFDFVNPKIYYIPHRRESGSNVNLYVKEFGFIPIKIEKPIELYFLDLETIPLYITGLYSAALLNIKNMTRSFNLKVVSFYIHYDLMSGLDFSVLDRIYEHYESNDIDVIKY